MARPSTLSPAQKAARTKRRKRIEAEREAKLKRSPYWWGRYESGVVSLRGALMSLRRETVTDRRRAAWKAEDDRAEAEAKHAEAEAKREREERAVLKARAQALAEVVRRAKGSHRSA